MSESLRMFAMWFLIVIVVIWWAAQLVGFLYSDKPRVAALWLAAGIALEIVLVNKLLS